MTNSKGRKISVFRVVVKMVDGTVLMWDCITQSEAKYWVENAVKVRLNNFPAVISRNLDERYISIDPARGGVHNYLLKFTTNPIYNRFKNQIWNSMGAGKTRDWVQKRVIDTKSNLVRSSGGAVFEALGFRYFGPVDGNDIEQLVPVLERLKNLHGPRLLHIHTRKGCGYAPAEENPTIWHAPGKFDPATGERVKTVYPADRYQDVFGQVLTELAHVQRGGDPVHHGLRRLHHIAAETHAGGKIVGGPGGDIPQVRPLPLRQMHDAVDDLAEGPVAAEGHDAVHLGALLPGDAGGVPPAGGGIDVDVEVFVFENDARRLQKQVLAEKAARLGVADNEHTL